MMTSRARVGLILPSLVVLAALALAAPRELPQAPTAESIAAASVRAAGPLDKLLHKQAETVYRALSARFQPSRAMEVVTFMDRYWRLPGRQPGLRRHNRPPESRACRGRLPRGPGSRVSGDHRAAGGGGRPTARARSTGCSSRDEGRGTSMRP